jgi:hypothetical protein
MKFYTCHFDLVMTLCEQALFNINNRSYLRQFFINGEREKILKVQMPSQLAIGNRACCCCSYCCCCPSRTHSRQTPICAWNGYVLCRSMTLENAQDIEFVSQHISTILTDQICSRGIFSPSNHLTYHQAGLTAMPLTFM